MIQPTGYWTFFCNTKQWDIDLSLMTSELYDIFSITRWQKNWFRKGQLGVVRVGFDQRTREQLQGRPRLQRGIYALVEILGEATPASPEMDDYWTGRYIVKIKYIRNMLKNPIPLHYFHEEAPEYDRYVVKGFQASSMPLKPEAFAAIAEGVGGVETLDFEFNRLTMRQYQAISDIERDYIHAVSEVRERVSHYLETGFEAQVCKRKNEYRCQICEALGMVPYSFEKPDGSFYVEVHHEMPKGERVRDNLVTVCANHHRQVHVGVVRVIENSEERLALEVDRESIELKKR